MPPPNAGSPPPPDDATRALTPDEISRMNDDAQADHEIGNYRLVRKLGEGGMGEVWQAEQLRPIRRQVALKLIRRGLGGGDIIARFESERQALALMDHPNIAKVLDAGATPDGRPYFVMEFVDGVSITSHCDARRLATRERLALFMQVCDGVQHAHQKAVIHRDIKPSNVLVTMHDGRAVPKIIDFGVAKATEQQLTERTLFTEVGQLIGTPEYMSPEQAAFTSEGIDTRTDVYALGVLLYELLVGARPLESRELRRLAFDQILRQIREQDPPRPSTRIGLLGADSTLNAEARSTDAAHLARELRGDLDWITMKAIEKDRARRYGSAAEFAMDIARFLGHLPIEARPPSASYRVGKFVRRHRVGVAAGAAAIAGLVAFAVVTTIQARRIAIERDRANQEAEASAKVADFLVELFNVSDPREARGRTVTAREVLDRGAGQIEADLKDEPALQARLLGVIERVYLNLGLYKSAEALAEKTLAVRRRIFGEDQVETLKARSALAWLANVQRHDALADSLYVPLVADVQRILGPDDPNALQVMNAFALLRQNQNRTAESESLRLDTLARQKRVLGPEHIEVLQSQNNLGWLYYNMRRLAAAESVFVQTEEQQRRVLGEDHPELIRTQSNLAVIYTEQKRYAEAESLRLVTLEKYNRVLGPEHAETVRAKSTLAFIYRATGRLPEAEQVTRDVLEAKRRVYGDDNPSTFATQSLLASILADRGNHAAADSILTSVLAARRNSVPPDPLEIAYTMRDLALLHWQLKRPDADALATEAFDEIVRLAGPTARAAFQTAFNSACWAVRNGDHRTAIKYLHRVVEECKYDDPYVLEEDDLKPLHGDPEFEQIVAPIRAKVAASAATAK